MPCTFLGPVNLLVVRKKNHRTRGVEINNNDDTNNSTTKPPTTTTPTKTTAPKPPKITTTAAQQQWLPACFGLLVPTDDALVIVRSVITVAVQGGRSRPGVGVETLPQGCQEQQKADPHPPRAPQTTLR